MSEESIEYQPALSSTMLPPSQDEYGMPPPPMTYGGLPMSRRFTSPGYERPLTGEVKGYERPTESWERSLQRYPAYAQNMGRKPPKALPTADPHSPDPLCVNHTFNVSEQNKQGVATWDRKHRGVSRNVLGGFYTS